MDEIQFWDGEDASMRDIELKNNTILNCTIPQEKIDEIRRAKGKHKIAVDFHVHGPYSIEHIPFESKYLEKVKIRFQEAHMPFSAVFRYANAIGLNAISVVGHNNIIDALHAQEKFKGLEEKLENLKYLIPGYELSSSEGHFLVLFTGSGNPADQDIKDIVGRYAGLTTLLEQESVYSLDVVRYLHDNKMFVGPAHPFSKIPKLHKPALYDEEKGINYEALTRLSFVELRNGFMYPEYNRVAERVYSAIEDKFGFDFKVAAIANSDSHVLPHLGSAFTTMPDTTNFSYNSLKSVLEEKKTKMHGTIEDAYVAGRAWFDGVSKLAEYQLDDMWKAIENPNHSPKYKLFENLHGNKPKAHIALARKLLPFARFSILNCFGELIYSHYDKTAKKLCSEIGKKIDYDLKNGIPNGIIDPELNNIRSKQDACIPYGARKVSSDVA